MRRFALLACAALAAAIAASGAVAVSAQQPAGTIKITAPANGATVAAPVTVSVEIGGVPVKPAAAADPNAYHYHIFVDVDPATVIQPGQPIPTGQANIIHTADTSVPLPNLAPGPHTVAAVLTKTDHVPLTPLVQDRVQFTVSGAAAGQSGGGTPASPRTGTGVASGATLPLLALPLALAALGGGMLYIRRRRNA